MKERKKDRERGGEKLEAWWEEVARGRQIVSVSRLPSIRSSKVPEIHSVALSKYSWPYLRNTAQGEVIQIVCVWRPASTKSSKSTRQGPAWLPRASGLGNLTTKVPAASVVRCVTSSNRQVSRHCLSDHFYQQSCFPHQRITTKKNTFSGDIMCLGTLGMTKLDEFLEKVQTVLFQNFSGVQVHIQTKNVYLCL